MVSVGEDRNKPVFPEPVFPESLLLPVMVFLTLASEPADLSSVGVRWAPIFGEGTAGLVFQTQSTRPSSYPSCYRPVFSCATRSAWTGLASPCLTSHKQPQIFEKGLGSLCQHSLILPSLLASHTEAALCYSPGGK